MDMIDYGSANIQEIMRKKLLRYVPLCGPLDYDDLFKTIRIRAARLWNAHITPELDIVQQRRFEHALTQVNMRAAISIPWVFGFGYAFGAACHHLAGGDPGVRDEAVNTGLYLFIIGTFDHLLDEHPEEFSGLDGIMSTDALERAVTRGDVENLRHPDERKILANGLLQLYRVYFNRCHRLLDRRPDAAMARDWLEALRVLHKLEHESVDRRISKVTASADLIPYIERASTNAFWCLALSACLGEGHASAAKTRPFAEDYGRLTWYADDVADLEADVKSDIWSGLGLRLALHARTKADIERIVGELADAGGRIVARLYEQLEDVRIDPDDPFTLADVLWAYVWAWIGGRDDTPRLTLSTGATAGGQPAPAA